MKGRRRGGRKKRQKEVCVGGERRELMLRLNELTVFYRSLEKGGGRGKEGRKGRRAKKVKKKGEEEKGPM